MKKLFFLMSVIMATMATSMAASRGHYDLLVAPARYSVLQVMFDVAATRPTILVSYQGESTTAEPVLHVWNGTTWNPISLHDLRELSFVQKTPTRAILIGNDDLLPATVRESLAWMPEVIYIRDLANANLLNEFGRLQKWSKSEWNWFATRYNLNIEDEAAQLRARSWYDRPASSLKKNEAPAYAPVPVSSSHQPLPPPTSLPLKSEVERPSDVPAAVPAAPVTVIEAAPVEDTAAATSDVIEVVEPTLSTDAAPVK